MIKQLGLEAAFVFAMLIDYENYYCNKKGMQIGDWFYVTRDRLEESTTLTAHKQKQAEKNLINAGLIEVKVKGVPAKNHYRICSDQVLKIFENWMLKNLSASNENIQEHITNNNTRSNTRDNTIQNSPSQKNEKITDFLNRFELNSSNPIYTELYKVLEKIRKDHLEGYLKFLLEKKKDNKNRYSVKAIADWFYQDYLSELARINAEASYSSNLPYHQIDNSDPSEGNVKASKENIEAGIASMQQFFSEYGKEPKDFNGGADPSGGRGYMPTVEKNGVTYNNTNPTSDHNKNYLNNNS